MHFLMLLRVKTVEHTDKSLAHFITMKVGYTGSLHLMAFCIFKESTEMPTFHPDPLITSGLNENHG